MSENVSFIQGSKENYNPSEMAGGVFFSKDTKEILLNGESYGNSVKADEEDITLEEGNLKLKDRSYDKANFSGMGRKILRKNIVNGVNTLTQEMMSADNTKYVIKYDYALGEDITVPIGCILEFDGGSITNSTGNIYKITLNNTHISNAIKSIKNIVLYGSVSNNKINTSWFDINNESTDDGDKLITTLSHIASHQNEKSIYFDKVYKTKSKLFIEDTTSIKLFGEGGIYKYGETYEGDNVAINLYDVEYIDIDGIKVTIDTIDRSFAENPSRFYCIWCRPENKSIKQCSIRNCYFIDNNSIINSTKKPYNGTIWVGGYNYVSYNISIINNSFENSCGRIIYCTNSENVIVSKNRIENAGYVSYTLDNNAMEVIAIRIIGCINNVITDNIIRFSSNDIPNLLSKVIAVSTNDNTWHSESLNSIVSKNIVDISNTTHGKYAVIVLLRTQNLHIYDNTFILAPNSDNRCYAAYFNGNNDDSNWCRKVFIKRNTILNGNPYIFFIYGTNVVSNPANNIEISENTISIVSNNRYERFIPLLNNNSNSNLYIVNNTIINPDGISSNLDGRNFYSTGSEIDKNIYPKLWTKFSNNDTKQVDIFTPFGWRQLTTYKSIINAEIGSAWYKVASVALGGEADFIFCGRNYPNAGSFWIGVSVLNYTSGEYQAVNIVTLAKHDKNFSAKVKYKINKGETIDLYCLVGGVNARQSIIPLAYKDTDFKFKKDTPPEDAVEYII